MNGRDSLENPGGNPRRSSFVKFVRGGPKNQPVRDFSLVELLLFARISWNNTKGFGFAGRQTVGSANQSSGGFERSRLERFLFGNIGTRGTA